ncbi:hypothetical protein GCM10007424_26330 [Flavobacterium suaedae]|uniref:Uncharacterized protein n=1 Tax=Flavobacterium suaedae TaxID=1767027 RepID=A0ABQ1K5N1_9FLAO|nr:hypothetical protein [Flavobacterium suaedae]GGB85022.1 hypothetical protein GCM10007424_26330 [Flavobacterium suaedae]
MEEITLQQVKDSLSRSGYLLENRIMNMFINKGFATESSHVFFLDTIEEKYREVDVIAINTLDNISFKDESLTLTVRFIVECINNPVPLGLFENIGDMDETATDWIYMFTNGSNILREEGSINWPSSISKYESKILLSKPSRQYCSFIKKKDKSKDEWMACHPNDFHNNLKKIAQYLKHDLKKISNNWDGIRPQMARLDLLIPVIVLQGDMLEIKNNCEIDINPVDYYRLKIPYEDSLQKNVSIDIVTEKKFKEYLDQKTKTIQLMFNDLKEKLELSIV